MPEFELTIPAIDSHTAGEPTRIVTGGLPAVPGGTMADKRAWLRDNLDHLRTALVLEPRGHDAVVLAYLLPPCDARAQLGVVFANDAGYLGMCGHGAIGVATVAVDRGMVAAAEPVTEVVLDTPAGCVTCRVKVAGGRVRSVAMENVASFLYETDVVVPVPGRGKVKADVAYGGNWFAFVHEEDLGIPVEMGNLRELLAAATELRSSLREQGFRCVHPETGAEEAVDHVKVWRELPGVAHGARAMTLCPGAAYDRSPCGTGTSAKLAVLHGRGELGPGQEFVSESVVGSRFLARIVAETKVGDRAAVVPEIEGSAWITGLQQLVLDPDDPLKYGIKPLELL